MRMSRIPSHQSLSKQKQRTSAEFAKGSRTRNRQLNNMNIAKKNLTTARIDEKIKKIRKVKLLNKDQEILANDLYYLQNTRNL